MAHNVAAVLLPSPSFAADAGSFTSPQAAVDALVAAVKAGDTDGIVAVLGEEGRELASSGDAVADAATRQRFTTAYEESHELKAGRRRARRADASARTISRFLSRSSQQPAPGTSTRQPAPKKFSTGASARTSSPPSRCCALTWMRSASTPKPTMTAKACNTPTGY